MLFEPIGVPKGSLEMVTLAIEEVEAIRLKDIDGLHQEECAARMKISRATFHQMLKSARGKLADAIISGKAIRVEGGSFVLPGRRFRCRHDGREWTLPAGPLPGVSAVACPSCRSRDVHPVVEPAREFPGLRPGRWGRGWQSRWGNSSARAQHGVRNREIRKVVAQEAATLSTECARASVDGTASKTGGVSGGTQRRGKVEESDVIEKEV